MIYAFDKNFKIIRLLENFESLIWADKYFGCGEMEFHAPYSLENAKYIYDNQENKVGVIESLIYENFRHKYKGRFLKSLLSNKVISSTRTYFNKTPEYIVKDLVAKFAGQSIKIEPNKNRGTVIENLQVTGENLMEFTDKLLENSELGARIDFDFNTKTLTYIVFEGTDNSNKMPLSKDFENIIEFTYTKDASNFKNFAYVAGEEKEGKPRTIVKVDRRKNQSEEKLEIWVDARDLQSTYQTDDGKDATLSAEEYKQVLVARGKEKLDEYSALETVDIEPMGDFEIGEIRTFKDGSLITTQRITERVVAYEENRKKSEITFGLQHLSKIDKIKREVKRW